MQILQLLDPAASQADDGAAPLLRQGHGEPVAAVRAEAVAPFLFRSLDGDPGSFRRHRFSQGNDLASLASWPSVRASWGLGPRAELVFLCASVRVHVCVCVCMCVCVHV